MRYLLTSCVAQIVMISKICHLPANVPSFFRAWTIRKCGQHGIFHSLAYTLVNWWQNPHHKSQMFTKYVFKALLSDWNSVNVQLQNYTILNNFFQTPVKFFPKGSNLLLPLIRTFRRRRNTEYHVANLTDSVSFYVFLSNLLLKLNLQGPKICSGFTWCVSAVLQFIATFSVLFSREPKPR